MNLIVLGPQGSGKGTQADLLSKEFDLEHIDMGGTLRQAAKMDTPLGREIYRIQNVTKTLVPSDILKKVLHLKFASLNREKGILIDGAPRTMDQVEYVESALQEFGRKISKVAFIDISEKESIERISKRWLCKNCKKGLIMGIDVKSQGDKCPECSGEIMQRIDDTEEGVKKRLEVFRKETLPVIEYFEKKGNLARINGEQSIEKVFEDVKKYIKNNLEND